jgi:hypothetical protein
VKRETGATVWCPVECYAAALGLHDSFDEVQTQSVTWNIRFHSFSAIKRLEEMTLIDIVDPRAMINDAEPHFAAAAVSLSDNFDLSLFITVFAVLERIAQEVLKTLRQAGRIGF